MRARHQASAAGDRRRPARCADGSRRRAHWCRAPACSPTCAAIRWRANIEAGLAAYRAGGPRRRNRLRRWLGARCRQGHRLHVGPDAAAVGFRGRRRLVDASRSSAASRPIVAVPTTAGTGSEVGRAGVVINEATHQKKIIFHPRMMPGVVISDPELTVGLPAGRDRRDRDRCLRALLRGLLRAGISSAGRRHRARGHAADPDLSAARLRERPRHRGALAHAGGGEHGRHRVPKGPGRGACDRAPGGRVLQHASRPDQRGACCRTSSSTTGPAIEPQLQVIARVLNLPGEPFAAVLRLGAGRCASSCASRTPSPRSA